MLLFKVIKIHMKGFNIIGKYTSWSLSYKLTIVEKNTEQVKQKDLAEKPIRQHIWIQKR